MSSTRLPGKVLQDIAGQPMLARVVERTRRAKTLQTVAVATTAEASDEPLAALCAARGYACYRGSLHDVLDRYYQAARSLGADVVVRITADCPVIDPGLVDETVNAFLESGVDFAANRLPPPWQRTYAIGLDTEVCTFAALERAWREADQTFHREHVMPYLYEGLQPQAERQPRELYETRRGFKVLLLNRVGDVQSVGRWTVDTPADLALIREVYARFPGRDDFTWQEVQALFDREPELARLNAEVRHKNFRETEKPQA
jgi:spore coat polysaccharide biosynthesis protein SpsF